MTKQIMLILFCMSSYALVAQEFITTWKTDNSGALNDTSITIPTSAGETYNYDVDWDNDGTFDEFGLTGNVTHDFTSAGTYTIRIQGTFPRIYFRFAGDKQKIISIDQWGANAWTSMAYAFHGASNLVGNASDTPDLSGVTDMSLMFQNAAAFNQDISSWNTSTITNMRQMFNGATVFNNGGQALSWNTASVTNLGDMFNAARAFNQDLSSWDVSNVTNFYNMFVGAPYNNGGQPLNWDLNGVTSTRNLFFAAYAFNQDISSWDMSTVRNVGNMFSNTSAFNQDLSAWNISNVVNFYEMFYSAKAYNNGGVQLSWDTTGLTSLAGLFTGAPAFNQDISIWDTSSVTNMSSLFTLTDVFDQDLSEWDVSNVTNFSSMFAGAAAYNNGGQPLSWDTSSAENMDYLFFGTSAFNQDISSWDVSNVTRFSSMFEYATAYNNGGQPLSWNILVATNMFSMFSDATVFNQDISAWNTFTVTNMRSMFRSATSFDQNIGGWNVESVTDFFWMFDGVTLSDANYDALLIGWAAQNLKPGKAFDAGNSQYCTTAAQTARTNMIINDGWTIIDGGLLSGTCGVLGIEDNELSSMLLYPNPVKDVVELILTNNINTIKLNLYNITGQLIFSKAFNNVINNRVSLDLSQINTGMYFLSMTTSQGFSSTKQIIKK